MISDKNLDLLVHLFHKLELFDNSYMMDLNEYALKKRIKENDWLSIDDPYDKPIYKIEDDQIVELYIGNFEGGDGVIAKKEFDEMFIEFPYLKKLKLDIELQDILPDNIFEGLDNLENLTLIPYKYPGIIISKELFKPIQNLRKLSLICPHDTVADNVFDFLKDLESFEINNKEFKLSNLDSLPDDLLKLSILDGNITKLDEKSFVKFKGLEQIIIKLPNLTSISVSTFGELMNLQFITLKTLSKGLILSYKHFKGLQKLHKVKLFSRIYFQYSGTLEYDLEITGSM